MDNHRSGVALLILAFMGGLAIPASAQSTPPVGMLQMPLVSPQQADQYLATRVVPPSDVPPITPSTTAQPPQAVNVDPVLGHDLPTDEMTPSGMPRADFAIAKPDAEKTKRAAGSATGAGPRAGATTTIRQQVPTIGAH